ncbi:carbon-nitrogen hydrolase family protein [Mycoplasmatota bacterium WC30]
MIIHTIAYKRLNTFNENLKKLEEYILKYKIEEKINLFFLGELIFTDYQLDKVYIDKNKYAQDSVQMVKARKLAEKHDVCISFGYIEADNDKVYNSQVFIGNQGQILHNHRKNNLTAKEGEVFEKGESAVTNFMFEERKISLAICYDLFSNNFKKNYKADTDILLHSLTDPQDGRFTLGFSGRFTPSYYVAANRYNDGANYYNGHIGIYSSFGTKIAFSMNKENVLSFDLKQGKKIRNCKFLAYIKIFFHILRFPIKTYKYLSWSKKN